MQGAIATLLVGVCNVDRTRNRETTVHDMHLQQTIDASMTRLRRHVTPANRLLK